MSSLSPFAQRILQHWETHRPTMVAELRQAGTLEASVLAAENRTLDVETAARKRGMEPHEARELSRQEWCLPDEETQPEL
jgi:hypothetical protein